jgi:hypothetical protein
MNAPLNARGRNTFKVINWRNASLVAAVTSILTNIEWVMLPFSFYGMHGRPGVLYGRYTLLQTFSFHPIGWVWWVLVGLQVFAILAVVAGALGRERIVMVITFALPAIGLLLLDVYIALRWGDPSLWEMYTMGALPGILLMGSGVCHAKQWQDSIC